MINSTFHLQKIVKSSLRFAVGLVVFLGLSCTLSESNIKAISMNFAEANLIDIATEVYLSNSQIPEFQSLDIYTPRVRPVNTALPVVIYVHGGGFRRGDKSRVQNKPQAFIDAGFIFVSTNYRLSPDPSHSLTARHPDHVEDIAAAIAWVHSNIANWGGDPNKIFLMGHSSGAMLVALVSTDEQYLDRHGLSLDAIGGTIAVDTALFDLVDQYNNSPGQRGLIANAFKTDTESLVSASPVNHIGSNKGIPPFLLTYTRPASKRANEKLYEMLIDAGVSARIFDSSQASHESINNNIGLPNDEFTIEIFDFIDQALN